MMLMNQVLEASDEEVAAMGRRDADAEANAKLRGKNGPSSPVPAGGKKHQ